MTRTVSVNSPDSRAVAKLQAIIALHGPEVVRPVRPIDDAGWKSSLDSLADAQR